MRRAQFSRQTLETSVEIELAIDACDLAGGEVNTSCGFLDHMLTSMAVHSGFALQIKASGDTHVDYHHLVEDVGICLGDALTQCLGDKKGITRFANSIVPMDESLCLVALDISGRPYLAVSGLPEGKRTGNFDIDLVPEFLRGFANHSGVTLHISFLSFGNSHHAIEAMFKGLGIALAQAVNVGSYPGTGVRSAKGRL